jgi:hypothetical protein
MKQLLLIIGAAVCASVASAEAEAHWPAPYKAFKGEYAIYSGELGNQQAPASQGNFRVDGSRRQGNVQFGKGRAQSHKGQRVVLFRAR